MAERDVHRIVIEPMIRMFGEHGTDDADLVIATYVRQFERFDADVLTQTWDLTVADFMPSRRQTWPPVALLRKHAEHIAEEIGAKRERHTSQPKDLAWSQDAIAAANRLIQSDMGRQAAREGWITQLHDYCRGARSLPDASMTYRLQSAARKFEAAYQEVSKGNGGTLSAALLRLGNTMLARRDELSAIAHGETA